MKKAKLDKSFQWLNATQFLSALNDNLFRLLMVLFLIELLGSDAASYVSAVTMAVFVIPFLLFLAFAGKLADRFSKRDIVVAAKAAEIVVMVFGCLAFALKSAPAMYVVLFMMATQSAFFGPAKYGIVPELVTTENLSRANSLLEAFTYIAIVIGTASAPFISQITGGRYAVAALICIGISVVGLKVSLQVRRTPPAGARHKASLFFVRDIWRTLQSIRSDKSLLLTVLASAYFLMIGAFIYVNIIPYGMQQLGLTKEQSMYLYLMAAIGIGAGAYAAGKLSGRHIEFGVVPLGALGLTISAAGLGLVHGSLYPAFAFAFLTGASAGLFIVPINAFIQFRSPSQRRGEILAASSFLGWIGVLLAPCIIYILSRFWSVSPAQLFVLLSFMTLTLTIVTIVLLPDFLVHFVAMLLTKLLYRIKVVGIENIPIDKAVMLVCNHVSWVDPLLLNATQQRRIRFVMDRDFYNIWWLNPICRLAGVIPISAKDPPKKIMQSLRLARKAMDEGFMVCIFAEGAITRTGMLQAFKGGFERIMKRSDYQIIPAYIGGAWGSVFSYYYGKPLATLPKKFPYPVSIHFGNAMPADSTAAQIKQKVSELSSEYFDSLKPTRRSLGDHFVQVARKNWRRHCISDSTGRRLNYGKTLISAILLSSRLKKITSGQEKIGLLLPPSAEAAIANLSVTILGKVSVNLNYVGSDESRESAIKQCGIKCIITSRRFMENSQNLGDLTGMVFLEDILAELTTDSKLKAYLKARFMPRGILTQSRRFTADKLATVIFSSGTSGRPKGVMLSHHNIHSNIEGLRMVVRIKSEDDLCVVLPFFHSFGFTCALWLPLLSGISATYIANPLDGEFVGRMTRENRCTVLFAPPTFLLNYIRRTKRDDFTSLRMVVAGAEKLKIRLADSFEAKFKIRPLEGYGATELSPVVSLNIPDFESGEAYQVGTKDGTIGHPIPGIAVRVIDVESGKQLAPGESGVLMVKGPNIMLGYLNKDVETANILQDGWYNTGDIGKIDEDGFLILTDRLSRFSKIGGEMVPHVGLEQVYLDALGTDEQVVAVTSVPEPKKGEELIVLYLDKAGDPDKLHQIVSNSNLPNMWKPRPNNYIKIDAMPILGSGKLDILQLRKIALAAKNEEYEQAKTPNLDKMD